jgi:hypothetical protein
MILITHGKSDINIKDVVSITSITDVKGITFITDIVSNTDNIFIICDKML